MHTGLLRGSDGILVPRRIINRFTARYNGEEILTADLHPAISADPYIQFEMVVHVSGQLDFEWVDDNGAVYRLSKKIVVA